MSLNLNKHGMAMQKAWKDVANPKNPTNWALYGYDTGTFDLNLIGTGEDGIDELKDDLSPERVQYAFIRIDDESTIPKFVFLVWIGESTPGARKGKAATHVRTIEQYFHGHHLTINARNEDDVDTDEITAKVAKISVSATGGQSAGFFERPEPVGSCHKKVEVKKELPDMNERERFWSEQENKEKQRIEEERRRKIEEQRKIDQDRRQREEKEAKAREELIRDKERKISQIRGSGDKSEESRVKAERHRWEEQQEMDRKEELERQNRGEEMRRKRSEEAKQLISQSSGQSARAVFERHTSLGQMNFRKNSVPPPSSLSISGANHQPKEDFSKVESNEVSTNDIVVPPPESFGNEIQQPEIVPPPPDVTHNPQPDLIQDVTVQEHKSEPDVTKAPASTPAGANAHSGYGICAMAMYDYQAADETEISFDPGQIITHIDKIDPGWWQGLSPSGSYGLFPSNYVDLIDPKDLTQQH